MIDVMQIQEILPHRYPFLLVDKITELKVKEVVLGYKNISISDHVFMIKWWLEAESNCRHADFQSAALPTELSNHNV